MLVPCLHLGELGDLGEPGDFGDFGDLGEMEICNGETDNGSALSETDW